MARLTRALALLGLTLLATTAFLAATPAAEGAPACTTPTLPITALDEMAAARPVAGKTVGGGWDFVVLGTVTEVRHKSPKFRYRITMHVDSALGGDLPALYTFFGSSRGTFPFETGRSYAVPISRRGAPGPLLPTTELWVETCDPVVEVADLVAAHDVIARTKPGYLPSPSPSPSPSASSSPTESAAQAGTSAPSPEVAKAARVKPARVAFPSSSQLNRGIRLGAYAVGGLGLAIALIALAESWWSRRRQT